MIVQALYKKQKVRGYLTQSDMQDVAEELGVPLYRIGSVVGFFPHFRTEPPPRVCLDVCRDMSCHLRGADRLIEETAAWARGEFGDDVAVHGVSCLGRCDRAPAAMLNERLLAACDAKKLQTAVRNAVQDKPVAYDTDREWSEQRTGEWRMDVYNGQPQYTAIRKYLEKPNPAEVLLDLETAGLLGMGGAGGRAYKKWDDVLTAEGREKYVVCNADESEPGTFKDREILLRRPHLTIEGMILGGLVVGASRGWVYVRHEYPEQVEAVERAIAEARRMGAIGKNIFGSGSSFELEVFVSPGGYICGEQTALIEAMEDRRAEPRNRPPQLQTNGLYDLPTLLSNVETFAWVPAIVLQERGKWFAEQGIEGTGLRLFSISGDVGRPGVYEVPSGIRLRDLINKHAGGIAGGRQLAAMALSGPSGGLLPPKIPVQFLGQRYVEQLPKGTTEVDILDLPLDIGVFRSLGLMLGGGMVAYAEGSDIVAEALALSRFFRDESCGKCVPCRIGSQKITAIGNQLASGQLDGQSLPQLTDTAERLGKTMELTTICGLGQVASNPIRTLLRYFPDEVQRRVKA